MTVTLHELTPDQTKYAVKLLSVMQQEGIDMDNLCLHAFPPPVNDRMPLFAQRDYTRYGMTFQNGRPVLHEYTFNTAETSITSNGNERLSIHQIRANTFNPILLDPDLNALRSASEHLVADEMSTYRLSQTARAMLEEHQNTEEHRRYPRHFALAAPALLFLGFMLALPFKLSLLLIALSTACLWQFTRGKTEPDTRSLHQGSGYAALIAGTLFLLFSTPALKIVADGALIFARIAMVFALPMAFLVFATIVIRHIRQQQPLRNTATPPSTRSLPPETARPFSFQTQSQIETLRQDLQDTIAYAEATGNVQARIVAEDTLQHELPSTIEYWKNLPKQRRREEELQEALRTLRTIGVDTSEQTDAWKRQQQYLEARKRGLGKDDE